ncbi:hypothetical protein ABW21_db0200690 [Orbilia brochopaga]|nr:hypothetical protein ABW21_db0200690 [Drechslerella brochopaga]
MATSSSHHLASDLIKLQKEDTEALALIDQVVHRDEIINQNVAGTADPVVCSVGRIPATDVLRRRGGTAKQTDTTSGHGSGLLPDSKEPYSRMPVVRVQTAQATISKGTLSMDFE